MTGPPRLAQWLLRLTVPRDAYPSIRGDLVEEFDRDRRTIGARARYWAHVLSIASQYSIRRRAVQTAASIGTGRGPSMMHALALDVRYALRALRKRPGFTAVVLATLALGIGAATAIFSVYDAIVLRPMPFHDADRLVSVSETNDGGVMSFSWPNYVDFRHRAQSYASLAASQANFFTVLDVGSPQRVPGRLVTWNFLDVLGVRPQIGRTFTAADDRPGADAVVIVSDVFWRVTLAADPNVLGRTLRLTERTMTIVGVLPPGFRYVRDEAVFVPVGLAQTPNSGWFDRGNHFSLFALGRLKEQVTVEMAHEEATRIAADLEREYPNTNAGNGALAVPLKARVIDDVNETVVALMGAVGFLLLLACVNFSNLLLARGAARQHELAVRTALGGSRWRLVRHVLVESIILSAGGGLLAIGLAYWLLQTLIVLAPADVPRLHEISLNLSSLLFALAATVGCGLVFGALPALQSSSHAGAQALARASRSSAAVAPHRTRRLLMGVEVALAIVLLTGCGLMARTMMRLSEVDPGFRADRLLTGRVALTGDAWTEPRRRALFAQLHERLNALPGIERAALAMSLPIEGSQWGSVFMAADKPVPVRADIPSAAFNPVSAGYFETMGIRLIRGRTIGPQDVQGSGTPVTVVNDTLASRIWPGEDAIGKRIKQGWPETPPSASPWREVVGVVADVKLNGVDRDTPMQAFLPLAQSTPRTMAIVARTTNDPLELVKSVEATVLGLNRDLPLTGVRAMPDLMRSALARQRLSAVVLCVFAVVALVLAAVGLYGVVAHDVSQRTREIGVRMALGAERRQVSSLFVKQGLLIGVIGTVAGLAGAWAVSGWLDSIVFGVTPTDPPTFMAVSALLLVITALACYVPARRAARIDPLTALRID